MIIMNADNTKMLPFLGRRNNRGMWNLLSLRAVNLTNVQTEKNLTYGKPTVGSLEFDVSWRIVDHDATVRHGDPNAFEGHRLNSVRRVTDA